MTESSANIEKTATKHDMNASRFLSRLMIDPESTTTDASRIAAMTPLVAETSPHRRSHRRQNAQFFGCFDRDTNNPDTDTDSIVGSGPTTSPHWHRHNARMRDSSEETVTPHCSGDPTTPNKNSMAGLDDDSSHLMQWQYSKRYRANAPVSPHNKARHTCSLDSSSSNSNEEDSNSNDGLVWAQGVTQLSQLYANGRYQKQRGEFITEDYFFRNDEGAWNHLEWHSSRQ
jgi:hypothetical protein